MFVDRVFVALLMLLVLVAPVLAQDTNPIYLPLLAKPAATPTLTPAPTTAIPPTVGPQPTATPAPPPPSFANCQVEPNPATAPNYPVQIVRIDKGAEVITLRNTSNNAIDLTGWSMCSITGNQIHPISGVLAPGEVRMFPGPAANIWNNSERDDGALYDPQGSLSSYLVCTTLMCP